MTFKAFTFAWSRRGRSLCALVGATTLMATLGCANYSPASVRVGQSGDEVIQMMGTPTARYAMPDGAMRLEFARGPFGKETYMVDLDRDQRVRAWSQVLSERNFDALEVGTPVQSLLARLGTPTHRRSGGRQGGEVWSYRYQAIFCQWFQVSVKQGAVSETSYGPDPACDVDRNDVSMLRLSGGAR